ncbi:CKLF-like MARVEL transmembrane domain-containing protein 4 [Electrophorus electricus]|uniref:CKLF-like MARVEL transmembrane domain-containing protein 4 n=1 Tax=Electrophorus electricus TaxID=8005 RepID=UPI0015CF8D72|nr:CKLF-like MARVEL transmembrane domain-containing protein 4 [Electrophorus electricus]
MRSSEDTGASSPYQPTTEPVRSMDVFGSVRCDLQYLRSHFGILKAVEVILSLMAFICIETVMTCSPCSAIYLFEFVSCSTFIVTGVFLLIFGLNLHTKVPQVNWSLTDLVSTASCTVSFFLASVVLAALNHQNGAEILAVIYGFVVMVVYGVNTYLAVQRRRLGEQCPLQASEYMRARTASRGEVETQPELQ